MQTSSLKLPDADDVSHFVQDDSSERAIRFQAGYVIDVKGHFAFGTDGATSPPNSCWTREA